MRIYSEKIYQYSLCFTFARDIVFQHKINFCIGVERMACFPYVWLCFISVSFKTTQTNIEIMCVYFEFTLLSSTWWNPNGFKSAHSEHGNFPHIRIHANTNLLGCYCFQFIKAIDTHCRTHFCRSLIWSNLSWLNEKQGLGDFARGHQRRPAQENSVLNW